MKLRNFSVGTTEMHVIDGASVRTAYIKRPVAQPWMISASGAEGNQVAVHLDHLYAYGRNSYNYWAEKLAVDPVDWEDGFFAENLTVDALDETALRLGDIVAVGGALLVVTGPRVPCWKLSWRMSQPKTFIREFRLSGRTGAYLGVLRGGTVGPGDPFDLIESNPGNPTVAELAALCGGGSDASLAAVDVVERVLASPHLSPTVRHVLSARLPSLLSSRTDRSGADKWAGWRPFTITGVAQETADVCSFELTPEDGEPLPGFKAGQHISVRLHDGTGTSFVRTWSLSRYVDSASSYRVTVGAVPGGRGRPAMLAAASTGEPVEVRAPAGRFVIDLGGFRPVVLIAAGIGITPFIAMVQAHLTRQNAPPLWLFFGSRRPEHTAHQAYVETTFAEHEDLHLVQMYSSLDARASVPANSGGRLSTAIILKRLQDNYMRAPTGETAGVPWFEADFYVCGPPTFNQEIRTGLIAAGANSDNLYVEEFTANVARDDAGVPGRDARVTFSQAALEVEWAAARGLTLLELAEECGLAVPFDCRTGTCQTCETGIIGGDVRGAVTTGADGNRKALLCSSYPDSPEVSLDA